MTLLSGCASGAGSQRTPGPVGSRAPTPVSTGVKVTSEPLPSPSPTEKLGIYQLGDTVQSQVGNKFTVYSWGPAYRPFDPNPGRVWTKIDVKICAGTDVSQGTIKTDPTIFSLEMPDSRRINPDGALSGSEDIQYDVPLLPHDCLRGDIVFQTLKGKTPKYVVFSSSSVIKWRVK